MHVERCGAWASPRTSGPPSQALAVAVWCWLRIEGSRHNEYAKTMKRIFVSYQTANSAWVQSGGPRDLIPWLVSTLKPHDVDVWFDKKLDQSPGARYKLVIRRKIKAADAAILLISEEFFASEFIADNEIPLIRKRYEAGLLRIIPILVSDVAPATRETHRWVFDCHMLPPRMQGEQRSLTKIRARKLDWDTVRLQIKEAILSGLSAGGPVPRRWLHGLLRLLAALAVLAALVGAIMFFLPKEDWGPDPRYRCRWVAGDGQDVPRSGAMAQWSHLLKRGQRARWMSDPTTVGDYELRLRYSNDQETNAASDRLSVLIDARVVADIGVHSTGEHGNGWDRFADAEPVVIRNLAASPHEVTLMVSESDAFGVEIDRASVALVPLKP